MQVRGASLRTARIGAYDGGWGSLVWRSGARRGRVQPAAVLRPAETRTVDSHVQRLRKKMGDEAEAIRTVWGIGYKVSTEPKPAPA